MIQRALVAVPGLLALAAGAVLAGGLWAEIVAAVGAITILGATLRPLWPDGPLLVAAALIVQVAVANEHAWWRTLIAAILLTIVLASGEVGQTDAVRAGWSAGFRAHRPAAAAIAVGVAAILAVTLTTVHNAAVATLLLGLATAGALITLIVVVAR